MAKPWFDIVQRKWGNTPKDTDFCVYELIPDPNYEAIYFPPGYLPQRIWVPVYTDPRRTQCVEYVKTRISSWETEHAKPVS